MIGKTILKVLEGIIDGDDMAMILVFTNGDMNLIQSGSCFGMGYISCVEIKEIPNNFEEKEDIPW